MASNKQTKPTTLYHYTTKSGKNGIEKDKTINKSVKKRGKNDVVHGDGVYLTELTPETAGGAKAIAINNFDGTTLDQVAQSNINRGKIDFYIKLKLKKEKMVNLEWCEDKKERLKALNRNVWLYKDQDIDLSTDVDSWEVGETPNVVKEKKTKKK